MSAPFTSPREWHKRITYHPFNYGYFLSAHSQLININVSLIAVLISASFSPLTALSAEFVSLSFPSGLCHRRLVFLDQRRRMEVRSSMPLRTRPCRFKACQCMAEQEFTTGRHYWDIETSACSGWAAGVAYTHLGQDERLGRSKSSWCIEWSSGSFSARHDSSETPLKQRHSSRLRVLLDMDSGHLSFWSGTDGEAELFDFRVEFRAPVRPVFWLFGTKPGNALSFPIPWLWSHFEIIHTGMEKTKNFLNTLLVVVLFMYYVNHIIIYYLSNK